MKMLPLPVAFYKNGGGSGGGGGRGGGSGGGGPADVAAQIDALTKQIEAAQALNPAAAAAQGFKDQVTMIDQWATGYHGDKAGYEAFAAQHNDASWHVEGSADHVDQLWTDLLAVAQAQGVTVTKSDGPFTIHGGKTHVVGSYQAGGTVSAPRIVLDVSQPKADVVGTLAHELGHHFDHWLGHDTAFAKPMDRFYRRGELTAEGGLDSTLRAFGLNPTGHSRPYLWDNAHNMAQAPGTKAGTSKNPETGVMRQNKSRATSTSAELIGAVRLARLSRLTDQRTTLVHQQAGL